MEPLTNWNAAASRRCRLSPTANPVPPSPKCWASTIGPWPAGSGPHASPAAWTNPDEGVWGWAKYGRLANLAANDKDELWDRVVDELIEVKFRPDLLRGFIRQTGLPGVTLAA